MPYTPHDRQVLRELATRYADIAMLPTMQERRALWKRHNALQSTRPMLLIFPEGSWSELVPTAQLCCETDDARNIERSLRERIYSHEHFQDDFVFEQYFPVTPVISTTGWGLEAHRHASTATRGAWAFEPVLQNADDLKKLHFPELIYDEDATLRSLEEKHELFGEILPIRLAGMHVSFHLMAQYTGWRGLNEMMMDLYEEPQFVHEVMGLLEEGHRRLIQQFADVNLLRLNNDDTYNSTGGVGYTDELPAPGFDAQHVRSCDMWASAESQEFALVSPEMHAEFALPYEKRLLEPFGLTGYGCCEDLTHKLDDVFTIPHIRRISISPFADVDICAEKLRDRYIFSWKPQPAHLCGHFDPEFIRGYLRHTLEVAKGCVLEIILKDTHTCEQHSERFDAWAQVARELIEEYAGSAV